MDKISPEEKIQWMKKILQKKESISSVASKIGVYYTTVDKWLRNYTASCYSLLLLHIMHF